MRFFSSFLFAAILAAPSISSFATDWPQWFGPDRTGIVKSPGWEPHFSDGGPPLLWSVEAGTGFSPVSVHDGLAYTMGYREGNDVVYCLHAENGEVVWEHSYPCAIHDYQHEGGPASAPLIDGDVVYTMSRDCDVFCFEAKTGEIRWTVNAQAEIEAASPLFGYIGSPALIRDRLILDVGAVVALDARNGDRLWRSPDAFKSTCASPTPFELDGKAYAAILNATGLLIYDVETGEERWRKPWKTPNFDTNTGTPIVKGNRVFITSGFDAGAALLELGPEPEPRIVWELPDLRTRNNTPRLFNGCLYLFDRDVLRCLDFETGSEKWSEKWVGIGSLIIVNDWLIALSEKGEAVFAEATPEGFREIERHHLLGGVCWTAPIFADDKLYCRNSKGLVVCHDLTPAR